MNYIQNYIPIIKDCIPTIAAMAGTLGFMAFTVYTESNQTSKIVTNYHSSKKNEEDSNSETNYVALYKCRFLCPKLTGALYRFNGKYVSASEYAKRQLNGETLPDNIKLNQAMDIELDKLRKGEMVPGCEKVADISIWTLPNIIPGGYARYDKKYTSQSGCTSEGFTRAWWS
jgi:hypothetical protein